MRELLSLPGLPDDAIYKEVVIIGNGPSGISVSHQLAGHWALLRAPGGAAEHPDPMLQARLHCTPPGRPLALQPLAELAEGLEGRSTNPVPLLVDSLMHPGADMGSDNPSMLTWKYYPERQIDHVVLGRGRPGGLWHRLDPCVATLSPARWMALPQREAIPGARPDQRAPVRAVAAYYERYVNQTGIQRFFRNHTMVTSVKPIKLVGKAESGPDSADHPTTAAWCVSGYDTSKKAPFHYVCSRVVLATGASDRPNPLASGAPNPPTAGGPDSSGPLNPLAAVRSPPQLKTALDALEKAKEKAGENPLPVLVIGSGLSAADAILRLRASGLPVAHAYRGASTALKSLPKDLYPEYHQVHEMMKAGVSGNQPLYTALPDHVLLEIHHNGRPALETDNPTEIITHRSVKLLNTKTNEAVDMDVSLCVVLIGTRPDLNFLPDSIEDSYITWNLDDEIEKTDAPPIASIKKEQTFEMSLTNNDSNGKLMPHPTEMCIKCSYKNQNRRKPPAQTEYTTKSCFLKTQWYNLKNIVGQGLQKARMDDRNEKKSALEDVERICEKTKIIDDETVAVEKGNGKHLLNGDIKVDDVKVTSLINGFKNTNSDAYSVNNDGKVSDGFVNITTIATVTNGGKNPDNVSDGIKTIDINSTDAYSLNNGVKAMDKVSNGFVANGTVINGLVNGVKATDKATNGVKTADINITDAYSLNNSVQAADKVSNGTVTNGLVNGVKATEKVTNGIKTTDKVTNGVTTTDNIVALVNGFKTIDIKDRTKEFCDKELQGCGIGLGVCPTKPIDCRNNPIAIDKVSHSVLNAPKGMYALGPLAGDNFVRFIPGGALAIVSHIWNEKKLDEAN